MFALSYYHASRAGNIGSRIKLDVYVVEMTYEADELISAMDCASFG